MTLWDDLQEKFAARDERMQTFIATAHTVMIGFVRGFCRDLGVTSDLNEDAPVHVVTIDPHRDGAGKFVTGGRLYDMPTWDGKRWRFGLRLRLGEAHNFRVLQVDIGFSLNDRDCEFVLSDAPDTRFPTPLKGGTASDCSAIYACLTDLIRQLVDTPPWETPQPSPVAFVEKPHHGEKA